MNFVEAILLALALCVDSLVVSATTSFRSKMPWRQGLLMAFVFGLCQGGFPLLGALIGDVARSFIEAVDHWVAFGLLLFVGGKMIVDSIKDGKECGERRVENKATQDATACSPLSTLHSPLTSYFLLGVATSIDALAVGIGLGLDNPLSTVLWVVAVIAAVTMLVSIIGVYLGKRNIPVPEKTANIIAGLVLIGLGVKILLEHLL